MAKKYFWLKLKDDFFRQKEIKKLRRIAGGDTFTIIYLKMQLLSLKDNGKLFYEGIEDNFCEELALEIDEDTDNVQLTVGYLMKHGLLEEATQDEYILPQTISAIGSESDSAERVRKSRAKRKLLQSNKDVQKCCIEQEIEQEIEQQLEKEYFEILKDDYEVKEIEGLIKYFIENNVAADVVKEKFLIVKSRKSIKNRVGSLISAIRDNWEMPKELKEELDPKSFNNFEAREYDYDSLETKLLGWDKGDNQC